MTIRPQPLRFIAGTPARDGMERRVRLIAMIASHLSIGNSSTGATYWMPALLTRCRSRRARRSASADHRFDRRPACLSQPRRSATCTSCVARQLARAVFDSRASSKPLSTMFEPSARERRGDAEADAAVADAITAVLYYSRQDQRGSSAVVSAECSLVAYRSRRPQPASVCIARRMTRPSSPSFSLLSREPPPARDVARARECQCRAVGDLDRRALRVRRSSRRPSDERAIAGDMLVRWVRRQARLDFRARPLSAPWSRSRAVRFEFQLDPYRHVVGRLLPGAHVLVDAGGDEPVGRLRREQQVVDADAVVLLPGAGLIVPERVEAGIVRSRTDGVGQSEMGQGAELLARVSGRNSASPTQSFGSCTSASVGMTL